MTDRCCGNCSWWKPTQLEPWTAPLAVGRCGFGPVPEAMRDRTMSANDGRGCPVFAELGTGRLELEELPPR